MQWKIKVETVGSFITALQCVHLCMFVCIRLCRRKRARWDKVNPIWFHPPSSNKQYSTHFCIYFTFYYSLVSQRTSINFHVTVRKYQKCHQMFKRHNFCMCFIWQVQYSPCNTSYSFDFVSHVCLTWWKCLPSVCIWSRPWGYLTLDKQTKRPKTRSQEFMQEFT